MNEEDIIKTAIDNNDSDKILQLGADYYNGSGVKIDYEKAVDYYKIAARMDNVIAMSNLGYCYLYGRSVEKDINEAIYYFEMAASFNDINAIYKLGDFYMWGTDGIEIDKNKAVDYYLRAFHLAFDIAHNGNSLDVYNYPDVCYRVANCFYYGNCMEKDKQKALILYKMAKEGFIQRIKLGDHYTDKVLDKTNQMINKIEK